MKFPKQVPSRNPKYLEFIRTFKCCIGGCFRVPSIPHHVFAEGTSTKCSDYKTIPLCNFHHTEFHTIGRLKFAVEHCIDYYKLIAMYMEAYLEETIN